MPDNGFVPDSTTAVRIAEAVLVPIYGQDEIASQQPLTATLTDSIWSVSGTLPKNMLGGVAIVELLKTDGRIIRVSHGL